MLTILGFVCLASSLINFSNMLDDVQDGNNGWAAFSWLCAMTSAVGALAIFTSPMWS